jgi:hypothetical protein
MMPSMHGRFTATLVLMICFRIVAVAQDERTVRGPILGFLRDPVHETIRPIFGVPGASLVGSPLPLGQTIRHATMSPRQDYALAALGENDGVSLLRLTSGALTILPMDGVYAGADVLTFSPGGTAAALYDHESRMFQSMVDLRSVPRRLFEFNASGIRGTLTAMAVADDGSFAALNFTEGDRAELWILSSMGESWIAPALLPSAVAFRSGTHEVLIGDSAFGEVFLLSGSPPTVRLSLASLGDGFDSISAVASSYDGKRVFVTSTTSQNILLIDVETRLSTTVQCDCKVSGLDRLNGLAVFRLSEPSDGPISMLDASSSEPRVVVMPIEGDANE